MRSYIVVFALLIQLQLYLVQGNPAAQTMKQLTLHFGAGCSFSDYGSLKADVSGTFYRLQYNAGLGKGVYVLNFTYFSLPNDDFVVLRASDVKKSSSKAIILSGSNSTGAFYSTGLVGEEFVLELYKKTKASTGLVSSSSSCYGFEVNGLLFTTEAVAEAAEVNKLAIGLASVSDKKAISTTTTTNQTENDDKKTFDESLCGTDESQEAICVESMIDEEGRVMFDKSQAVARLVIGRDNNMNVAYCTGFLLGCEGHLITNQHCIRNWLDAVNTQVEFLAQAQACSSDWSCQARGACPGPVKSSSPTLVAVSTELDYALVKLSNAEEIISQVGGYLQLRSSGPQLQEEIYIPQYPLGWGKRIAWTNNGQPGRIESLTASECGGSDAGYYVDTQEGSSGSPVIARSDNFVVALHHCGGCLNGGIQSQRLIADLTSKGVLPRCATA